LEKPLAIRKFHFPLQLLYTFLGICPGHKHLCITWFFASLLVNSEALVGAFPPPGVGEKKRVGGEKVRHLDTEVFQNLEFSMSR